MDIPSNNGVLEIKLKSDPHPGSSSEKSDMTPENSEKTSPSVEVSNGENNNVTYLDNKNMTKSCSLQEIKSRTKSEEQQEADDVKKTLAFTIDFGDGKDATRQQRHKSILERFEQRHKRGQSLSKLEENDIYRAGTSPNPNKPPLSGKLSRKRITNVPSGESSISSEQETDQKVKLRDKNAQIRDSSKRHSWSPRSSIHENLVKSVPSSASKFKSSAVTEALEQVKNYPSLESKSSNDPQSLDSFLCSEPPLESFPTTGDEAVSDAGTYTVDGDNYTEEQKEKMNIDKIEVLPKETKTRLIRPTCFKDDLEVIDLDLPKPSATRKSTRNVLEVSYSHQEPTIKAKVSYLDKLKSRVKNISDRTFQKKSPEKQVLPSPSDLGCFTSVTTSGILSYKPTLDDKIQVKRKNSLCKATVDSSEYVQGLTTVNVPVKSVIDGEKVEINNPQKYKLNIFHKNSDTKASDDDEDVPNPTEILKTASTKKDWIQEWARNAREYSGKKAHVMTRSYDRQPDNMTMSSSDYYDSEDPSENQSFYAARRQMAKNRSFRSKMHDNEYSSDPNLRYQEYQSNRRKQFEYDRGQMSDFGPVTSPSRSLTRNAMLYGSDDEQFLASTILRKPPMSPSKIPSPMNTMGRPRSVSRTRGSLHGSVTNLDDEADIHLQNTAAAISALANLQRRNSLRESLRNNSLRNSPRSPLSPQHRISPSSPSPIYDPSHSFNALQRQQQHFRSDNPDAELLQEYIRRRRPSYEQPEYDQSEIYCHGFEDDAEECAENIVIVEKGQIVPNRPTSSPVKALHNQKKLQNVTKTQHHSSPIKRSSSFSVKAQTEHRQKQPTTPRLTQRSTPNPRGQLNAIQKSASSTSFKQMMHRYEDDECEFYINNNDNLNPEPDYSSDDDGECEKEPITNTKYNKAFLMRVEKSKKVIASSAPTTQKGNVACPNTPQMSRHDGNGKARMSLRERASMPRDSSLNRLKEDITRKRLSDITAKDSIMSRSAGSASLSNSQSGKVLPKYLDISKYKATTTQGQNFLKKDESKSYLTKSEVKRTPSSASVIGARNDVARASIRSVKSAGSKPGIKKLPDPVAIAQEAKKQELEMWKRRAKYDPMKAAAEGKRKQQLSRQQNNPSSERQNKNFESSVLRSQSFHCGVDSQNPASLSNSQSNYNMVEIRKSLGNQWNMTSTESSDIDDDFNTNTS
ncbi:uncharacterized protein LOC134837027 [Culicoides brevitarsis]|uniref:uncharacterized protein LOC134837027 n=1 Tax=Culicoides brevitarsis TaxID=469753 RepID=UPI00307BAE6A